jgi:RND family efflux transporter MFP subunit
MTTRAFNPFLRTVTALALCGAATVLTACGENAPKAPEVRPVRTAVVDPMPIENDRTAVGEVRARHESDLAFRVSGKVVSRVVDVGATVKKGDLLARLDDQDYRNRLKAAESDLTAAAAVLEESRNAEARQRALLEKGVTTRANYDSALKNLRSNEAKLEAARAALDLATDQLRYAELAAEFDGIVTAVGAEPGQIVNVGQMIVRLAQPNDKDGVFSISEAAFRERGAQPPEIVVSLLSNPGITAEGIVREVSPVADPTTRTYQAKVTLKNPPEQMRFGASIVGRLRTSTAPVVVLPGSALFDKAGQPAVWVVEPASGTVSLRQVVVNRYETDRVVVGSGLAKGDIVVTAGVNRLRENQKVRLAEGAAK